MVEINSLNKKLIFEANQDILNYWDKNKYFNSYDNEIITLIDILSNKGVHLKNKETVYYDLNLKNSIKILDTDVFYICQDDSIVIEFGNAYEDKFNKLEGFLYLILDYIYYIVNSYEINFYVHSIIVNESQIISIDTIINNENKIKILYYSVNTGKNDMEFKLHFNAYKLEFENK